MKTSTLIALALAAALSGCGVEPTPAGPTGTDAPTADAETGGITAPADTAPPGGSMIISPATLLDCDAPAVVGLEWDFSATVPAPEAVDIWVGAEDAPELFTSGGAKGSARTDAWAVPGLVFRARDPTSARELGRAVVQGPECPAG